MVRTDVNKREGEVMMEKSTGAARKEANRGFPKRK